MIDQNRNSPKSNEYFTEGGLENFIKRLEKGMQLSGRILDCADEHQYLLRIWGYNILTESKKSFQRYDEVRLVVREVSPHLILDLVSKQNHQTHQNVNVETNILV
ncbi:MAG: hypothetical protein HN590_11420 [Calditrichaeota bacterium]|jgi:hypothetical protein|nr:hypothetical protein [Calditrichota bacterium]MBT7789228.1 hypothetical protein [Calditrichota bacterium]